MTWYLSSYNIDVLGGNVMTTLKDVAKQAGVSLATASYCVNNSKSLRGETRAKIMKAVEELNYIPNAGARNLKVSKSNEIGVVTPEIDDHAHSEILKGIVSAAEEMGYILNIAFSYNNPKMEQKLIKELISKNVAGLIIMTCQPNNIEFFRKTILERDIPNVFLERFPVGLDVNFYAFDDYKTCYQLTKKLIDKGYRDIALVSGSNNLFAGYDSASGFIDAHDDCHISYQQSQIIETNMTKESAFRETMYNLVASPPQAIITISEALAKGVLEACSICNIKVPQDVCVLYLGEESWNKTNYYPDVIPTIRTVYTMGKIATETLINDIANPNNSEKTFNLLQDKGIVGNIEIPSPPRVATEKTVEKQVVKVLVTEMPTTKALEALTRNFALEYNAEFQFDFVSYRELIETIRSDGDKGNNEYDLYLYDVSWLTYLANAEVLLDLTPFLTSNEKLLKSFVPKNMENCKYKDKYFGIPIIGGANILFYRRDLFESTTIQRMFNEQHRLPLRAPRTWSEFNGIARFFTKKYNENSPTEYGTAITGYINEEMALEIQIRLWGLNGGFYDEDGRLSLVTPQNIKAFKHLLETNKYVERDASETSISQSFQDFGAGKTAMLISYSEYATQIRDEIHGDIISRIGYAQLPGTKAANVGWNLGVNKHSDKLPLIEKYFEWIGQKQTSYYMTILSGQSTVAEPYKNHELLKLYPWMELTEEGQSRAKSRIYPYRGNGSLIPPYQVEEVLCQMFAKMKEKPEAIKRILAIGEKKIQRLFS